MPELPARPYPFANTSDERTSQPQLGEVPADRNINVIIVGGNANVTVSNVGIATAEVGKPIRRSAWSYVSTACRRLAKLLANTVSLTAAAVTVWLGMR